MMTVITDEWWRFLLAIICIFVIVHFTTQRRPKEPEEPKMSEDEKQRVFDDAQRDKKDEEDFWHTTNHPEAWTHYLNRHLPTREGHGPYQTWVVPPGGINPEYVADDDDLKEHIKVLKERWKQHELDKRERQRKQEREDRDAKLAFEKDKQRQLREIDRNIRELNQEQRELDRRKEKEAEQERKDPTPVISQEPPVIPYSIRDQHIFIPGATRQGKSTQMLHLILEDIKRGDGVAVLDPVKAHLVRDLCSLIPEKRIKDCIWLSLKNPIPLDIFRATPNPEQLVGDIKSLVLRGNETLSRAEPILTRLVYSLLQIPGSKFTDIEEVFTDKQRKQWFMEELASRDPRRFRYWSDNWPKDAAADPLINRMTDFTENPSLRMILGDPYPQLDLRKAMDERKIILVDLSGPPEIAEIYGTLLVMRFQQAAYARADRDPRTLTPFNLYVDEFEHFQTPSFAKILEVAGGLKLHLTVGNQHVYQLSDDIRHAIFGNVGTFIVFKVREGFDLFSTVIHPYQAYRLPQIPKHQAVFKVGDRQPVFAWTRKPPSISLKDSAECRGIFLRNTLKQYGPSSTIRSNGLSPLHSVNIPQNVRDGKPDPDNTPED